MKNSEEITRSFKAIAVVFIIGLTIMYNSNFHRNTWKGDKSLNVQADTTQLFTKNESHSRIEILRFTTKLIATGIKQLVANN